MEQPSPEPPQFPAGPFVGEKTPDDRRDAVIEEIERAPTRLREAVSGLAEGQLDTRYKNWTIRQIVHHVADSHLNSYMRFKLALTEARPTIKPYNESRWSELADARGANVELSLQLLHALHLRWAYCSDPLRLMSFTGRFSIQRPTRSCLYGVPSPTMRGTRVITRRKLSG